MRRQFSFVAVVAVSLCITAACLPLVFAAGVKTQLCLVVDGSGSISDSEWNIIKQALSEAIEETIPHDGSVELIIVQYGYAEREGYAKTELPPTVINSANYAQTAAQVLNMSKGDGNTPTAHGINLAWQEINSSPSFNDATKQVIKLATDGTVNVRTHNATLDLDGSGGAPSARDDLVATVNFAINGGLDELDVEGIGILQTNINWLKNWAVHPQPAIVAPPFSKAGWIRIVADPNEFASTIRQKIQVVLSGSSSLDTWAPPTEGVLAGGLITVGVASALSALGTAVSNPASGVYQKVNNVLPTFFKKWLHKFIASKRKIVIEQKTGHPFKLSKVEVASYAVALVILTFAFAYAKGQSLEEFLAVMPTVLATSIVAELVKNIAVEAAARKLGVWTEHRLWYFGAAAFLLSTIIFRAPFSSPSRNVYFSRSFTKRSLGLVATMSVAVEFGLTTVFGVLILAGFSLVGSIGLVVCITLAFFETLPIPPMNGKDIYDWNKTLSAILFIVTLTLYALCLLLL